MRVNLVVFYFDELLSIFSLVPFLHKLCYQHSGVWPRRLLQFPLLLILVGEWASSYFYLFFRVAIDITCFVVSCDFAEYHWITIFFCYWAV